MSRSNAHAHSREGCSIEHVFGRWRKRLERRPPGASVQSCLLGSWRGWTGPRCRPRDMRCDIEGRFHLRYTRLDPSYHGKTSGMDQMSPNRTRPRSIIFLSFPLGGLSLSPTTAVDIQPPPDLGFATRSSVPAILLILRAQRGVWPCWWLVTCSGATTDGAAYTDAIATYICG